ncbi:MAG: peptidoglycan DD-metalloendopeptidase family protein, partial [Lachnospiraceae bacterium]|nr:peptidoglycan DD-metalloendopeptidase family protein [Lachnospiraceae bacterium]
SDGTSSVMAGSYLSEPVEIDAADLSFTEREARLEQQINSIETDYPDYDEYDYNLAEIGHNPATLIGYLSARHTQFTAAEVDAELQELFEAMYTLTLTPETETRYRDKTDADGNVIYNEEPGEAEQEAYQVSILRVKLERTPLETVVDGRMDAEQKEVFHGLYETRGLLQTFGTPVALYWYNYISSYYGYRADPFDGTMKFHRGVDIAVPTGTSVYSGQDGTVSYTGYDADGYGNYIVIENAEGYMTKYAHLSRILVSQGQSVRSGDLIGKSGNTGASTGSHLHIECLYQGEYYNPLFYFEVGEGTLYGEDENRGIIPGNPDGVDPPGAYDDARAANLIGFAEQYLGRAYVWGGSTPETGFDCSGFVCYVYTNSGTHNLPRTTAQGIYNQCNYVSAANARPGDLIFFTGTYHSANPVTHVGIYCGDGVMLHCGDPIKYTSINTPYWQQHFYNFGRL